MACQVAEPDLVRRFVLERHPIRGHAVRLSRAWLNLREHQDYPPAVQQLLGEAVGAVVLLAATLKFDGTLTLQLQGKGLVNLLVAQCTHDFKVRGMARHDPSSGRGEAGFPLAGGRRADRRHRRSHRSRVQLPGRGADHRQFAGRIARGLFRAVRAVAHARVAGRERRAWWRACWCSAFPARAASRRSSIPPRSKRRGEGRRRHVRRSRRGELLEDDVEQRLVRHVRRRRGARVLRATK